MAAVTFPSFLTVERNQLAPSAARVPSLMRPVTTGASATEIQTDSFQAASSRAAARWPAGAEVEEPQAESVASAAMASAAKMLILVFIFVSLIRNNCQSVR